jgi:hypothetical protein
VKELEKSPFLDDPEDGDPFTAGRIFTVAVAGAFTSLLLYYAYQQLEPSSRKRLKNGLYSAVKGQVRSFVGPDDDDE